MKSRFFENEAELSGSDEAASDEDVDLREEDDVMMEEEGDQDEMPDDEELIQQIGKAEARALEARIFRELGDVFGRSIFIDATFGKVG